MPATTEKTENDILIQAIQERGDVEAFQKLFDRYSPLVMGLSYKIVGNRTLAEDIAQETFWRIWNNAASFDRTRGNFTSWMFGIARNLSIDTLRRNKRVTIQPIFDEHTQEGEGEPLTSTEQDDIADLAWARVKHQQVKEAMKELPDDQHMIVLWIFFQGKTRRQIAEEHDIPLGTVNTRARLALKKLHNLLTKRGMNE
ncbi:MAG: sigma-70 family RNA polymerase sigma factor [Chloroflexota bacterium]